MSMMDVRLARVDNLVTVVTSSGGQNVLNIHQSSGGSGGSQQPSPTPGSSHSADIHMGGANNSTDNHNISSLTLTGAVGAATVVSIKQESLASIDSLISGGGFVDSTTFLHSPVGQMVPGCVHGVDVGESIHDDGCGQGEHLFYTLKNLLYLYVLGTFRL